MIYSFRQARRNLFRLKNTFGLHVALAVFCLVIIFLTSARIIIRNVRLTELASGTAKDQILIETKTNEGDFQVSELTLDDVHKLGQLSGVINIAPTTSIDYAVNSSNFRFLATTPDFLSINSLGLQIDETLGESFNDSEIILSQKLATQIFNTPIMIGRQLEINGQKLMVGNLWSEDSQTDVILISPKQFLLLFYNYQIQKIILKVNHEFNVEEAKMLLQSKNISISAYEDLAKVDLSPPAYFFWILSIFGSIIIIDQILFAMELVRSHRDEFALRNVLGAGKLHNLGIILIDMVLFNLLAATISAILCLGCLYLFQT